MGVKGIASSIDPINFSRYNESVNINNRGNENATIPCKEDKKSLEEELIRSIEMANEKLVVYGKRFEFSIHQPTKHIMVKVVDAATDEIIREIPPEKILDLIAALWELAGIIVDERV